MVCRRWSRLRLRFDPATEISIYRSIPHASPRRAPVAGAAGVVRGAQQGHPPPRLACGHAQGEYHSVPGGHMFPLERPPTPPA
jgi:hypothetical protein